MAYKQEFGRAPVTNKMVDEITSGYQNGGDKDKPKPVVVSVPTSDGYNIDVNKDTPMYKQYEEFGSVLQSQRAITVNKDTDPRVTGLSNAARTARIKALPNRNQMKDPNSGN
jgi:hypothetical protein